jgi:imidazolonepropionase-like amidohydrolase
VNRGSLFPAIAALMVCVSAARVSGQRPGTLWAVKGAVVIDGTGAPPMAHGLIVGASDRITCVGPETTCRVAPEAVILDAAGKWVVPGLIDTHVHTNWAPPHDVAQLVRFAFGATTTREAGWPSIEKSVQARSRASAPDVPEPRVVSSALASSQNLTRYGVKDYASLVRAFATLGADAIKLKQPFSADDLRAIVNEAHRAGLPVFGHVSLTLTAAVNAGVDGYSHMFTFSDFGQRTEAIPPPPHGEVAYWVWWKEMWNYQDEERLQTAIDMIVRRGGWLEPMLVTERHFTLPYPMPRDVAYLGEPRSLEQIARAWLPVGNAGWIASRNRRARLSVVYARMCRVVEQFVKRGGIVVTGTDGEAPGPGLADEIALLTECGLSPMAALRAATQQAAAALSEPDIGTIQTGKLADFVILDRDPLQDPANLRQIWRVVKGGHVHDPAVLLAPLKAKYRRQLWTAWSLRTLAVCVIGVLVVTVGARLHRRRGRSSSAAKL